MAIDWITPGGKTQADLDAVAAKLNAAEERQQAEKLLLDTDQEVLGAVETYLLSVGGLDQQIVDLRRAARDKLKEGEL